MTDLALRLIALGGLAILVLLGVSKCQRDREALAETRGVLDTEQRTAAATSGIVSDIATGRAEGQQAEQGIREIHYVYQQGYQQARRDDPHVAAWGDTAVPERMRQLARERREQRERLGCTGDGCGGDGPTPGAHERR